MAAPQSVVTGVLFSQPTVTHGFYFLHKFGNTAARCGILQGRATMCVRIRSWEYSLQVQQKPISQSKNKRALGNFEVCGTSP